MTWSSFGDEFLDRPELVDVSRSARLLLVELYLYANKHLTDGFIKRAALKRLTDSEDCELDLKELIEADVLEVVDDGYRVDWADQESAATVRKRRAQNRVRQARFRAHVSGDHSDCGPKCKASTREVTRNGMDSVTSGVTPVVTGPLPAHSRSGPKEPERGYPQRHKFNDDGSGLSCDECNLPQGHRVHDA